MTVIENRTNVREQGGYSYMNVVTIETVKREFVNAFDLDKKIHVYIECSEIVSVNTCFVLEKCNFEKNNIELTSGDIVINLKQFKEAKYDEVNEFYIFERDNTYITVCIL